MKNLIIAITALLTISACNNNKSDSRDIQLLSDSTAYLNNMYGDTSASLQAEPVEQPASREIKSVTTSSRAVTQTTSSSSSANNSGANNSGTQTTQTTEKKGWSSAAKGAVIGAGAGAVGGAIISKKQPVKGAVIGGAVGAAGGYIIGKDIDKRKGR
jgi:cobalamin biosynthesis Mg chelatase CobN